MDIVDSIERYLSGGDANKGARTRMVRARDKIVRLQAEIAALRKDLDDALLALRHLRSCQHRPPIIDGDSEAWWRAAVDEADLLLTRFAIPTVQQESDHWGIP